jgi:DNA-binding NtrC family response regulator
MRSKESSLYRPLPSDSLSEKPEVKVLVINSCQQMAKEITLELMQSFVGAAITYAPTFTLAKMMISKRSFDLVVSSSRMPDGRVQSLQASLNSSPHPPALVVIGDARSARGEMLGVSGYLFSSLKKLEKPELRSNLKTAAASKHLQVQTKSDPIKNLGADIRNDLNNPLQEIVAMVYVAKSQNGSADVTQEALEAINRAAGNLSSVVKGLEQKIRLAVAG